jgi:hypothetical protein
MDQSFKGPVGLRPNLSMGRSKPREVSVKQVGDLRIRNLWIRYLCIQDLRIRDLRLGHFANTDVNTFKTYKLSDIIHIFEGLSNLFKIQIRYDTHRSHTNIQIQYPKTKDLSLLSSQSPKISEKITTQNPC